MLATRVDAVDFLAQLDEEVVSAYDITDATITTIVTALLAMQLHTTPITLGTIEPVVTRSILVEDQQDSILGVLSKLRDTVGGYIEVDNDRQLNWWNDIGEDKGQQIRYKKNVKGLSRTLEFTNFGNRLYCYGAGEGDARVKLSEVQVEDYVEDVPSQGTYGMCIRQLTDKSITDPDVLLAWANLKLAEMKDPRAMYRVDMVNLEAMGWGFDSLRLGSIAKVIDEDLGIDIDARIVKITRDLTNPENIQVEISNPGKDIIDTMGGVYDTQQFYDHIATKIGAGQVTVLGAFSVADWVTGGTTNIIGDYIRTGTLQSNNWGAGAGSQFNLDNGTFKMGGSAAPKLSWDGTTLKIVGTLQATNIEAGSTLTVLGTISAGGGNVKISSTGINIFGLGNALTTRATEAGTIQCYVGADGAIYAGAGAVYLNASGLIAKGTALILQDSSAVVCGWVYGSAGVLQITPNATGLFIGNVAGAASSGTIVFAMDLLPNSTVAARDIGSGTQYFDDIFCSYLYYKDGHGAFDDLDDIELIKSIKTIQDATGKKVIDIASIPKILRRSKTDILNKKLKAFEHRKQEEQEGLIKMLKEVTPSQKHHIQKQLDSLNENYDNQIKEYEANLNVDNEGYLLEYPAASMTNLLLGAIKQLALKVESLESK